MEPIQIYMLGAFSIRSGECILSDSSRSRKSWQLLAYLICHRGQVISPKKLIELFWSDDSSNPENAVRITFHRVRSQLDKLFPGAGKKLILYKDAGYTWNDQIPISLDFQRFDALCTQKAASPQQRLEALLEALTLYRGDFLEKHSSEIWVIPISTHYHNLYVQASLEAAQLLSEQGNHDAAAQLCRRAIASEPYHEELHQVLIRELAAAGNMEEASRVYEQLSKRLFNDFGIRPNEQTRTAYREAVYSPSPTSLTMDMVMEHVQEKERSAGALQIDYDYFKVLCHVESRSIERYGSSTHVVLLSVDPGEKLPLTRRSINRIMEQLGQQIRSNLRRGDTFSQCSANQYIIMLPKANYENSCMVCRRILGAFERAHPHVTAQIHYMVQPLCPEIQVP